MQIRLDNHNFDIRQEFVIVTNVQQENLNAGGVWKMANANGGLVWCGMLKDMMHGEAKTIRGVIKLLNDDSWSLWYRC